MKRKYTESDYRRMHQGIVEDMVDQLLGKWHDEECDPLKARVCRNLAYALEGLRSAEDCMIKGQALKVWVSAANEEAERKQK